MWRVRPLCRAGGFDARLFAYHDEADGCLKLKNRGYRCLLAPSVRVSHQGHATGSPSFLAKQYLIARNSILLARTHFPRYTLGRVLFFALLYLGASRLFPKSVDRKIAHMRVAGWLDGMISRGVRSAVRKLLLLPTEGS
jgi:GT2 family glycosyltransferase